MKKGKENKNFKSGVAGCVLPFFPGFYGSCFDLSDVISNEADLNFEHYLDVLGDENADRVKLSPDDFDATESAINAYKKEVAERYVAYVNEYMPDFVIGFQYTDIESPRSYNFSNDKVICDIFLKRDWVEEVQRFIDEYRSELAVDIANDWSSKSGFWSFIDDDVDNWLTCVIEEPSVYLPLIIEYMICYNEGKSCEEIIDDISMRVYENVYMEVICTNKEAEKIFNELS